MKNESPFDIIECHLCGFRFCNFKTTTDLAAHHYINTFLLNSDCDLAKTNAYTLLKCFFDNYTI